MIHSVAASLQTVSSVAAGLLIASLWQGVVLAALVSVFVKVLPEMTARSRFQLWIAAFSMCAILPGLELAAHLFSRSAGFDESSLRTVAAPLFVLNPRWSVACLVLWVAAASLALTRLAFGLWGVQRLLQSATLPSSELQSLYARDLRRTKRGEIALLISNTLSSPVATGFTRPSIIVPHYLLETLTTEEMEHILRHELEHLDRRDDWTTLWTRIVRSVFPLSPALFYIERQLAKTRELACDDAVLEATTSAREYAACLARMAELSVCRKTQQLVASFLGESSQLSIRIGHILDFSKRRNRSSRVVFAAATIVTTLLAATLISSPDLVSFATIPNLPMKAEVVQPSIPSATNLAHEAKPARLVSTAPAHRAPRRHFTTATPSSPVTEPLLSEIAGQPQPKVLVLWHEHQAGSASTLVFVVDHASQDSQEMRREIFFFQI